jgi:hypothetical protein
MEHAARARHATAGDPVPAITWPGARRGASASHATWSGCPAADPHGERALGHRIVTTACDRRG